MSDEADATTNNFGAWLLFALVARLAFWVFLIWDLAQRWGEPVVLTATTVTVVWAVAWLASMLGRTVLKVKANA